MRGYSYLPGRTELKTCRTVPRMTPSWITLYQRGCEFLDLIKRDMRWHWGDFGVGFDLKENRAIRRKRLVPGRPQIFRAIDKQAFEADEFGEPVVGHVGNAL